MLGPSQGTVGERLGISFQAVQKYKSGRIRVSASRLLALAELLDVPVTYFFEALPPRSDGGAEIDRATAELFRIVQQLPGDLRTAFVACMRSALNY